MERIKDALGECANMVTGVFKTRALDPVSTFYMSLPGVTEVDSEEHLASYLVYQLAHGTMRADLWLED